MRVSIVIPCYNYGRYLSEAIESALDQTEPCEVVVVDDGSTDDTPMIPLRYPVLFVRSPENYGLSHARNLGVRAASGTHILPLDADDVLEPSAAEQMLYTGTNGIVRCGCRMFGAIEYPCPPASLGALDDITRSNCITATSLFPRAAWEAVGGYDEAMVDGAEDWDFWTRIIAAGYPVYTCDALLFRYRKHGHTLVSNTQAMRAEVMAYLRAKWEALGIECAV